MKIYTKKGDKGDTDLINLRVKKDDKRIEIIGQIDELMVLLAMFIVNIEEKDKEDIVLDLKYIYKLLFNVQTHIADTQKKYSIHFSDKEITFLESKIDGYSKDLPKLTNFVYYTGDKSAMMSHQVRSKVRTIERLIIALNNEYDVDDYVLKFINRLSDYFYTLARYLNKISGVKEEIIKF